MKTEFKMKNLGVLRCFLILEIKQVADGTFLSKELYAKTLLKKFRMLHCSPAITLWSNNEKFVIHDGEEPANPTSYRSLVGGLFYLSHTCPDIAFAVSTIFRFMDTPSKIHFTAAIHFTATKRILQYIAGIVGMEFDIHKSKMKLQMGNSMVTQTLILLIVWMIGGVFVHMSLL